VITDDTAWLMLEACRRLDRSIRRFRILELGNQHAGWAIRGPVKSVMTWFGADHVSLDTNGMDGSLRHDLREPLPASLKESFDLVTNAGTSEHVNGPARDFGDQWQVFKTIHDALREVGAMMHVVPDEQGHHGGCGYLYAHKFFPMLARCCSYELVELYDSRSDENHVACLMLKTRSSRFPDLGEFVEMGGILRT
jgi:hypothetical protein